MAPYIEAVDSQQSVHFIVSQILWHCSFAAYCNALVPRTWDFAHKKRESTLFYCYHLYPVRHDHLLIIYSKRYALYLFL